MNTILRTATTWGAESDKLNANFNTLKNDTHGFIQFGKLCNFDLSNIPEQTNAIGTENTANFHSLYDALVTAYPNYVSRIDCSSVDATLGLTRPTELTGLPIYIYKFSPKLPLNTSASQYYNKIKVFVNTGTHGTEKVGIKSQLKAMELICNSWATNKNLEDLRFNIEFYIMPCSNPYGIDNNQRTNYNGVDLNRNMPVDDFAVNGVLGDYNYSGATAGSEYETQILMHYLNTIIPDIYIDYHNSNAYADGYQMLHEVYTQLMLDVAYSAAIETAKLWQATNINYPDIEDFCMVNITPATPNHTGGFRALWAYQQDFPIAVTIESVSETKWSGGVLGDATAIGNVELTEQVQGFIQFLLSACYAISTYNGKYNWVR